MDLDLVTPPASLRAKAALTTTLVALGTGVFASIPVMALLYFTDLARPGPGNGVTFGGYFSGFSGGAPAGEGGPVPEPTNPAMFVMDTWVSLLALSVVCLVVVLVASRMGKGAVGDAVFHLDAIDASGATVSRWRNLANAALPVLVWFCAALVTNPRLALLAVAALWLPALFRADRRSTYSLVTGTNFGILPGFVPRKGPKQPPVDVDGSQAAPGAQAARP